MVNRIKKIAEYFALSPTAFADRIEVARPVISHIFSERNRPSLEVIQKVGLAFPEVDLKWLLYGKGNMLKPLATDCEKSIVENGKVAAVNTQITQPKEINPDALNTIPELSAVSKENNIMPEKRLVKVLFFYQDNTFSEFKPDTKI